MSSRRGKPYVRIVSWEETESSGSSVWEARERYESEHGLSDIPELPVVGRKPEPVYDPFDSYRSE